MYFFSPTSIIYSTPEPVVVLVRASPIIDAALLRDRTDYCTFLIERREPQGVPSSCDHSCIVAVIPSFSDITDVSTIVHRLKTDRNRAPLIHVAQYGDDIIGRIKSQKTVRYQLESNPQPSQQLRPMTIKTSASAETSTAT